MIKANEIAEAISAIDAAMAFVTGTDISTPGRSDVQIKLIRSRVDLEFALKAVKVEVITE